MAEAGLRRAQGPLAQHAAFRIEQREGRVVADGADIAEMIGDALELRHQRAEPDGARRNFDLERRLDRLREGERVSDGAVARGAARKRGAPLDARARHQRLDALMHIAEPLFEPHDGLAVGGEAEMSGLDDAGMDRADRNLVEALALDRQERVGARPHARLPGVSKGMGHAPEAEIEPGPRIGRAHGFRPKRSPIARSSLIAGGWSAATEGNLPSRHSRVNTPISPDGSSISARCTAPSSPHRPSMVARAATSCWQASCQSVARNDGAPPRKVGLHRAALFGDVAERGHGLAYPRSLATFWNQATSGAGR